MTQIITALIGFFKAIEALRWLGEALERWAKAQNENTAWKRLDDKDAAVDSGIDAISRLHSPEAGKQPTLNETSGLSGSSDGGSRVDP
jgi:hypothetical protein